MDAPRHTPRQGVGSLSGYRFGWSTDSRDQAAPVRRAGRRLIPACASQRSGAACGVNVAVQPLLNAPLRKALLHVTRRDPLAEFRQEQRIFVGAKQPAKVQPVLNPETALRPIGRRRSLLPLPITHTSPDSRSRCFKSRFTSSERRRPAPYITSSIARSRTASGSLRSISSRRFTSSTSIFSADDAGLSAWRSLSPGWLSDRPD